MPPMKPSGSVGPEVRELSHRPQRGDTSPEGRENKSPRSSRSELQKRRNLQEQHHREGQHTTGSHATVIHRLEPTL